MECRTRSAKLLVLCLVVLIGCNEELDKRYAVTETYEVVAGAQSGLRGVSKYEIRVLRAGKSAGEVAVENFAKAYRVRAIITRDSVLIPKQDFPYHDGRVTIYGHGGIRGDTLMYDYFSGGPAGQINCRCIGVYQRNVAR